MTNNTPEESISIPNTPWRFFLHVSKGFKMWVLLATLFVFAGALGGVYLRFFVENIIEATQSTDTSRVVFWVLMYPLFVFFISICWRLSGITGQKWLLGVPKVSSDVLSSYVARHSHGYFGDRFAGSVSNKVSNVAHAMEEFVGSFLWSYLESSIPLIATVIIFLYTDVEVGLLYLALIVLTLGLNILLMPRKRKLSVAVAEAQSKTSGLLVDILSNMQAVRQFVAFPKEASLITAHTSEVQEKGSKSFLYSEYTMLLNSLLFAIFSVLMFWILLNKWEVGEVTTGRLVTFLLLISSTAHTITFLGRILSNTAKIYGRAEEGLTEILLPHEIVDSKDATTLSVKGGEIIFKDIYFTYGEQTVFKSFNLTIAPGQRLGLVGPSGAGKSTFVSLLLRQQDIASGAIMIDGQNIAQVTQYSLRSAMAIVPQEPALFHRTIKDNILYGNPSATEAELVAVAKKAEAYDFIMSLPQGVETMVGERGVKLSGGQKQRVAIARAMLKNAPILILDEATSALDSESEAAIQKALHILMEGKTVIAIAHRLSTLKEMDRLIVLENGVITEDGTHSTLASGGGTYERLWEHQAGGFVGE